MFHIRECLNSYETKGDAIVTKAHAIRGLTFSNLESNITDKGNS